MNNQILVVAEHLNGSVQRSSLEAIKYGIAVRRDLEMELLVIVINTEEDKDIINLSLEYNFKIIHYISKDESYSPEKAASVLHSILRDFNPFLTIFSHTYRSSEIGPIIAMSYNRMLVSNCINYSIRDENIVFVRRAYHSKLLQEIGLIEQAPYFISVQQCMTDKLDSRSASGQYKELQKKSLPITENRQQKIFPIEVIQNSKEKLNLEDASIIVAGGRGVGNRENFDLLFEFAEAIGGAVGATRPVVDAGWLPKEYQIGISGQIVAPRYYFACGISGAFQHASGIINSDCIIAINKDPGAPIFHIADYGIVGDIIEIIPSLTKHYKSL